jgi:sugar transferase (PEP-CTERM/EpsH1 system associated)
MASGRGLRILMLTITLPYPPEWGAGIQNFQHLKHLASHHRVTLLAYGDPNESEKIAALQQLGATVLTVSPPDWRHRSKKRLAQLRSMAGAWSYQRQSNYSREMQDAINWLLCRGCFDLALVEASQMSLFDFGSTTPLVLDAHNIEHELLYRTYRVERSPLRKLYAWREWSKFRSEEIEAWKRFDGCVLQSERERQIVQQQVPSLKTVAIPNGVDLSFFDSSGAPTDSSSIVFTGTLAYRPNQEAVTYFVRNVLPRILANRPDVVFTIVGGGASPELLRLASRNVSFTGRVPDIRPYLRRAAVVVVPLRIGSGVRLKVIEALAMGKPVVSTSLGCEGLQVRPDQHLLIANDPSSFAAATLRLLEDHQLAERLGGNGRALAEREHSWPIQLDRFNRFLVDIASAGGRRDARSIRLEPQLSASGSSS